MKSTPVELPPSARLSFRVPNADDLDFLFAMNQDPVMMEFMPGLMTLDQTRQQLERMTQHFADHGFGTWIVSNRQSQERIGAVGLKNVDIEVAFAPAVEIAWRLARSHWGHGYATEAARQALLVGFGAGGLERVVGFTVPRNTRSIAVFERLGMQRDPSFDFQHPKLPEGHPLRQHVFFEQNRQLFAEQQHAAVRV